MQAQVTLTVEEAKALIGLAVAMMPRVARAAAEATVVLHPSSTTWHILHQLTPCTDDHGVMVCGMILPKGTCISAEAAKPYGPSRSATYRTGPGAFPHSWVVKKGQFLTGIPLGELLDSMGPGDVYIKGVNALDVSGKVGVLIGSRIEGGTIGMVLGRAETQGFEVIYPCGLEKLIPWTIAQSARVSIEQESSAYSMGMRVILKECQGTVVTELEAIDGLTGALAIPVASGGLNGAEGSKTFLLRGIAADVERAIAVVLAAKSARRPRPVEDLECDSSGTAFCANCSLWRGSRALIAGE